MNTPTPNLTTQQSLDYLDLCFAMSAYDDAPSSSTLAEMVQCAGDFAMHKIDAKFVNDALIAVLYRTSAYLAGVKPPVPLSLNAASVVDLRQLSFPFDGDAI